MSSAARKLTRSIPSSIPAPSPVPNRRILIVDDEVQIADSIKNILCPKDAPIPIKRSSRSKDPVEASSPAATVHLPFEVVVVHTPADALKAVEESLQQDRPFAMGFFDVLLGADIDGVELVKQVQAMDSRIHSVFVTAYHDRSVDSISKFLGDENLDRWDYINKPFTEGEILQKAKHLSSVWDLHRLKEWQEERLAEAHKLLLYNERQNTLSAVGRSFAHEFGNFLTHIIGNADMALLKNDEERMRSALKVIVKASDTAASLLKQFRTLSAGDRSEKRLVPVNLQIPMEEALELMGFQFRKSQIEFVKERFESVLLLANKHSLVQVFMNLFINASHAMPTGGKIYLNLYKENPSTVKITIRDTGTGIPPELVEKVTEPLFTTKGTKGTGLGLAITKEIVEIEHRGHFKIENHPDGGVMIEITLPTREDEES
jgi:signal transduction histidine kinase